MPCEGEVAAFAGPENRSASCQGPRCWQVSPIPEGSQGRGGFVGTGREAWEKREGAGGEGEGRGSALLGCVRPVRQLKLYQASLRHQRCPAPAAEARSAASMAGAGTR